RFRRAFGEDTGAVKQAGLCEGRFALMTHDESLSLQEALLKYKYQPFVEKRHEQLKSVFGVAPVWLKNAGRIESLLWLYYVVELLGALVRASAPQTAHILRGRLIWSRVNPYDSPAHGRFTEENDGPAFSGFSQTVHRPVDPQALRHAEGPAAGPPALTPPARYPRHRPLCRHRRRPGLARDRDLRPQAQGLAAPL